MGNVAIHRRYAEECVAMAQRSEHESDKALWLTLAQSWVRLAEHVAHGTSWSETEVADDAAAPSLAAFDHD
jgi:hypothetical protein